MTKTRTIFFPAFSFFLVVLFGLTATKALAAPLDCAIFKNGSLSVSTAISGFETTTSCFIAADEWEGVDTTALQTEEGGANLAVLTIDRSVTLQSGINRVTRLVAGSIAITGSGSLAVGSANTAIITNNGLWVSDVDADGWPGGFSTAFKFTATASGIRRLGHMRSDTAIDCNDSSYLVNNNCYAYSQSAYYAYSQSAYYAYSQSAYYVYSQSAYWRYAYTQSAYWRYNYTQSAYWRYNYTQSAYWRYAYSQGYYCFLPDTKILMADGSYKEIWHVKAGDEVVSYNVESKKMAKSKVVELIIHPNVLGEYLLINNKLKVTLNHPILINGEWKDAGMAVVGDTIVNSSGESEIVKSIEVAYQETHDLYNLHLDGSDHNYFADDVLVHNK